MMSAVASDPPLLLLDDGCKSAHVLLDGCTVRGSRGYSLLRASRSIAHGCWYVEVSWLLPLDDSTAQQPNSVADWSDEYAPAVRVGWCTAEAPVDAPVGFDEFSFGYASRTGQAFHSSAGKPYGRHFGQSATVTLRHSLP